MNRNESIQKIKDLMKNLFSETVVDVKLTDITLQDGTIFKTSDAELAIDSVITKEDGSVVEDGEYTLENGSFIEVVGGIVTKMESTKEEVPAVEEADVEAKIDPSEVSTTCKNCGAEMEASDVKCAACGTKLGEEVMEEAVVDTQIGDRVKALEDQLTEILSILKDQGNMNSQVMSKLKEIGDEPGAEPVKNKEKVFETYSKNKQALADSMVEIEKIREIIKKKK